MTKPVPAAKRNRSVRRILAAVIVAAGCHGTTEFAIVGDASPAFTQMIAEPTEIKADGVTTSLITVRARDMGEHNLREGGDVVVLQTTLGTLGPITDKMDGTYTTTLRSVPQVGTARISGLINGGKITTGDPQVMFLP